jgi:hypothetical protein
LAIRVFAPEILVQPQATNVLTGSNVTFTVVADPSVVDYQWFFNGGELSHETNSFLTLTDVTTNNTGQYNVVVDNASGSTSSADAWLQVYPAATLLLSAYSISNNLVSFTVSGITNSIYLVQAATNLASPWNWASVYTGTVTFIYSDPAGVTNTNYPQRFYRAQWAP